MSPWVDVSRERADAWAAQGLYCRQVVEWLRRNFPEWNHDGGNRTHATAIATVVRLHWTVGRGKLTVAEHGALIRGAVARWEMEFESQETI